METLSERMQGTAGEAAVLFALTNHNIPCYTPFGDGNNSDIVMEVAGRLYRVQVKSCSSDTPTVQYRLARRDKRLGWQPYEDVDYFALYSSHYGRILLVPWEEGRTLVSIRFKETCHAKPTDIRADEVDLHKVLEELSNGV